MVKTKEMIYERHMLQIPITSAFAWFVSSSQTASHDKVSTHRDVFQARIDRLYRDLIKASFDEKQAALFVAVVGEIGNNVFDHNLGRWQDVPGCWLEHGLINRLVWCMIADRGQGFYETLRTTKPELKNNQEAINLAFTEIISGRFPEKRGNGLKFVKKILEIQNGRGLFLTSGQGVYRVGQLSDEASQQWSRESCHGQKQGKGAFALVLWEF